jgi:hypothetical protein
MNLLPLIRKYRGEFKHGRRIGRRLHVSVSKRGIVRECFHCIAPLHRRRQATNAAGQPLKPARLAFYLGAIATIRAERRLLAYFRL